MEWDDSSEQMLRRVPFFVRKTVRRRVEEYAASIGSSVVTPPIVQAARQAAMPDGPPGADPDDRFFVLRRIEKIPIDRKDIPMYEVEACQADAVNCPLSVAQGDRLVERVRAVLEHSGVTDFVIRAHDGPLLPHHRFKVSISSCPSSCSQVQVKDIGILAQLRPKLLDGACTQCGECIETCREDAIEPAEAGVVLDGGLCLYCGQCIRACPTEAIEEGGSGYALYIGGRLGRHPRLADKIADLLPADRLVQAVERLVAYYIANAQPGERFSNLVERIGPEPLARAAGLHPAS